MYEDFKQITKKYDCVVLMNVLREIEPSEWASIFNQIENVLNDNGYLLFVEERVLHTGEMHINTGILF